jgi:putative restriction endonuclease
MRFFVGVTDKEWYRFLAAARPEEVNFWRPSGLSFGSIPLGCPFLFKLHSPLNAIAGGGYFVRAERLSLTLAWETFGIKNGAASLHDLRRLILSHRGGDDLNPEIGCIVLNEPFFFDEDLWIPTPPDWRPSVVVGKTYDTADGIGRRLWQQIVGNLGAMSAPASVREAAELAPVHGKEYLTRARLGQGMFRLLVEDAYSRRCAVTGERTRPVLQAAHIKPIAESGPNRVENGLLLRSDLHILFDRGYITVTRDHRVEVSRRIRDEFDNGHEYDPFHGRPLLVLPESPAEQPSRTFIDWHNEHVFLP